MKRVFKMSNASGREYSLNQENGVLAINPSGLGVEFSNTFTQVKANFRNDKVDLNQNEIPLSLLFGTRKEDEAYQLYSDFINFLNSPPFVLYYITDAGMNQRECVLKKLSKSEKSFGGGMLKEDFILEATTPWFTLESFHRQGISKKRGFGKIYDYRYSYRYNIDEFSAQNSIEIQNRSLYLSADDSYMSPTSIQIKGPVTNPAWNIYSNGSIVQSDRILDVVESGETLIVSSYAQDTKAIKILKDGTIMNVYPKMDHSKTNFVRLPVGKNILVLDVGLADFNIEWREEKVIV
ncbi:MAG: phage distal tail protein domain-containing protein [Enterococcus avium]|nr:MAG TPA: Baseplate protein [Caudoviricetes sp.]